MNSLNIIPSLSQLLDLHPGTEAIFFDMDGTLCDSEHLHAQAMNQIAQEFSIIAPYPPEIVHQKLVGKADHFVFQEVKEWPGFPASLDAAAFRDLKNKNLLAILERPQNLISIPMRQLLDTIIERKITLGLVTSSEKIITHKILQNSDIHHLFDFILTRDDCPAHKPDPWPYIKAIELAQKKPQQCIIFEDSQVGLTAAKGSGAHYFKVNWF